MNLQVLAPLTANGSDQPVDVPRGYHLIVSSANVPCEVRDIPDGPAFPVPADTPVGFGASLGQTVFVRAPAGTTIYLALG